MAPTNPYIDTYRNTPEQKLIEDIIIESIRFNGIDIYYLPRKISAAQNDSVYGEDPGKYFDEAFLIEMYLKDVEGWGGEKDIISRFGLEIREQMTFQVAIRRFNETLQENPHLEALLTRPREGDLLFLDFSHPDSDPKVSGTMLEITFTEHESIYYQLGELQVYEMNCETFRYSGEEFTTGIVGIDQAFANGYSTYVNSGNNMPTGLGSDNVDIETEADLILDYSEDSPFGDYGKNT